MWNALDLVRVYTRPKGKQPDYSAPVVLRRSRCSVEGSSLLGCSAPRRSLLTRLPMRHSDFWLVQALTSSLAHLAELSLSRSNAIHKEIVRNFKSALVIGTSPCRLVDLLSAMETTLTIAVLQARRRSTLVGRKSASITFSRTRTCECAVTSLH